MLHTLSISKAQPKADDAEILMAMVVADFIEEFVIVSGYPRRQDRF